MSNLDIIEAKILEYVDDKNKEVVKSLLEDYNDECSDIYSHTV